MQQFLSSISFCLSNIGYLFILCVPVITLEVALASLIGSIDIQTSSDSAALEAISEISFQFSILLIASIILSVALSGGCMVAFRSLSNGNSITPYQALFAGLKKFFPLLWANIMHSIAYGLGFLMLILPGFYLYGRLGLFPLFIMFDEKRAMDSLGEYFNDDGKSLEKAFLRAPLDFAYVSSHFNPNRRHPILNTIRAHNGVDYAAKRGTPIRATGEGVIQSVGWKSGYGRTIVIRHGGEITTLYAHLEKYHSSISRGMKVTQGQTIGYVGDSGLATAPHLHYEFRIGEKRTDPLKVALPSASPINKSEMNLFKIQRNNYMQISDQLLSKDPNEKLFR